MREILFRGKTNYEGKDSQWVYGSLLAESKNTFPIIASDYDNDEEWIGIIEWGTVDPETVGQYTGLTDKNGKKIFEGDIILFEDESPTNYEYHDCTEMRCGEIKFHDGQFYLTNRYAVEMGDLVYDEKLDGKVIGNIHDNPELLSN